VLDGFVLRVLASVGFTLAHDAGDLDAIRETLVARLRL
jgi:hypothetical protein